MYNNVYYIIDPILNYVCRYINLQYSRCLETDVKIQTIVLHIIGAHYF